MTDRLRRKVRGSAGRQLFAARFSRARPAVAHRSRAAARRLDRQLLAALLATATGGALLVTLAAPPRPRLVWNISASAPPGLYWVRPGAAISRGDRVVAWPPPAARVLAARRHYLPANVPLVKRVMAGAGDRICAQGAIVVVDGARVADRLARDRAGRRLTGWRGCATLRPGQFLLLNAAPDSFDGRYFGASASAEIVGRAVLLWPR